MSKLPLEGIKVVDFTWHLTGPLTTKFFSDCGAEVIHVESHKRPDIQREGSKRGSFNQYNTSKLGVTLNLSTPEGLALVKRLIARADIVVDNFAGGAMDRMGLGYAELKEIKPDIIMLSSCMQGQTGPHARHPGSGHKLTALAGISSITGWPDRSPGNILAYTDFVAPRFNVIAIMAALIYRRRTGKGQFLDMSQYENSVHFVAPQILDYTANHRVAERMGNQCSYAAPHNAYRCLGNDRWCVIAAFSDEEWHSLCRVMGSPGWTADPRFSTLADRKQNETELDRYLQEWTISRSAEDVMSQMQAAGVPAGVVETGEDLLDRDPQLHFRRTFIELEHPEVGKYRTQAGPHFLSSTTTFEVKRAPLLGEHNHYVFQEILGMSDDEFQRLEKAGVIN
jgi:benzylsuccinate CoA-transferase BbsF subunit